ncbi:MAG: hypothetical protein L0227_05750 [Chloroflexi bacterium]|nr:hypothetical protein [Chloroflexota bacterium]
MSHHTVIRALRAERPTLTLDFAARASAVVGMELAASLHPAGAPARDKGHLALLERLRRRLAPSLRWRPEVPVPIPGDPRSADAVIESEAFEILVEAETHLYDVQALERAISGKQRDLGIGTIILLVADTRHNRQVISSLPDLRARFPIPARVALAALARGQAPGGDAIIVL